MENKINLEDIFIPKNTPYCYKIESVNDENGSIKIKSCSFYKHTEGIEGYCYLIKSGIDDQIKDCGISSRFPDEID